MAKKRRFSGVEFYPHKKKRKTPIFRTTQATNDFLVLMHQDNPDMTISQLKALITDESKFILEPQAVACLDTYINAGEGDVVPNWW